MHGNSLGYLLVGGISSKAAVKLCKPVFFFYNFCHHLVFQLRTENLPHQRHKGIEFRQSALNVSQLAKPIP
jgi:hypothetical protein